MKNMFKKHSVAKFICIFIILAIVLTWIIPGGLFNGSELIDYGKNRIGFSDIPTIGYNAISFCIDKIVFLIVLAGFYGIVTKTSGYNKLVSTISKKIKGKETIFVLATSVLVTALTAFTTQTFAMLVFVPFIITIMINSGINKVTAFASTFGAILVGILGAIFGTEQLVIFNSYFSATLTKTTGLDETLIYRIIVLLVATALYNFFLYFSVKKSLSDKKKKSEELVEEEFKIETSKKDTKLFPIIITFALLAIIIILGFVDWSGNFKIECFNKLHESIVDLKIGKDFAIIYNILGANTVAFGTWDLFTLSAVLGVFGILIGILYSVKFDDILSGIGNGVTKSIKPVAALVGVYSVFIIVYMSPIVPTMVNSLLNKNNEVKLNIDYNGSGIAFFNIDSDKDGKADFNLINQDNNNDGKCDLNCDTNKDGYPDKNIDFNADGQITEYDEVIGSQFISSSVKNLDTDNDGIADVNITETPNTFKATIAAILVNAFQPEVGYTGYAFSGFLTNTFGANALGLIFVIFMFMYGLLQFVAPTAVLLMVGLSYTNISVPEWLKYIWRFVVGMLFVIILMFIFLAIA